MHREQLKKYEFKEYAFETLPYRSDFELIVSNVDNDIGALDL